MTVKRGLVRRGSRRGSLRQLLMVYGSAVSRLPLLHLRHAKQRFAYSALVVHNQRSLAFTPDVFFMYVTGAAAAAAASAPAAGARGTFRSGAPGLRTSQRLPLRVNGPHHVPHAIHHERDGVIRRLDNAIGVVVAHGIRRRFRLLPSSVCRRRRCRRAAVEEVK